MLFIATLLLVSFGPVFGAEWVSERNGGVPSYAFKAGTDEDGFPLYVCRLFFKTELCAGKVNSRLGTCLIPYFNEEHDHSAYSVVTAPPWEEYTLAWRSGYSNGRVPNNAVRIDSGIYVGRYNRGGHYIPGKIVQRHNAFFYGYDGREYETRNYEALEETSRPVDHYEITNVVYDLSGVSLDFSSQKVTLAQQNVMNDSPYDTTSLLSMTFTDSKTSEWSQTDGFEVRDGKKLSVSAEIAIFSASAEVTFENTKSTSYTQGESYQISETTTHEVSVNLPAHSNVTVSMLGRKATGSIPYTGTLRVVFINGHSYEQPRFKGVYTGSHFTSFETAIKSSPMETDGNGGTKPGSISSLWVAILFLSFYIKTFYA